MLVGAGTTSARRRAGTRFPYTAHPYLCPAFHARRWYARLSLHPSAGKDWYVFLLAASAWDALRGAGTYPASARSPVGLPSSPRTHSEHAGRSPASEREQNERKRRRLLAPRARVSCWRSARAREVLLALQNLHSLHLSSACLLRRRRRRLREGEDPVSARLVVA
jgi:hypothetical protein